MSKLILSIDAVEFENLRVYDKTSLNLTEKFIAIVGENNEGKSSALRLLDFFINKVDNDLLHSNRVPTYEELNLLLPANNTKHRARRVSLYINFSDARRKRRFVKTGESKVLLRLSVVKSGLRVRLNYGKPKSNEVTEDRAIELLELLRKNISFTLIPAIRDATSLWFNTEFKNQINEMLLENMKHNSQSGASSVYRDTKKTRQKINEIVENITLPVWESLKKHLVPGMVKKGSIKFSTDLTYFVKWLVKQGTINISTGIHDENKVLPSEVGHGLQSLLGISLGMLNKKKDEFKTKILAIEEPEAFLHPNAQRLITRKLRNFSKQQNCSIIITTHSPQVLEESKYNECVIVRKRKFYNPTIVDFTRQKINTNLMNVSNSESFFARLVFLVEGASDKAFYDIILRRLQHVQSGELISKIYVQAVGGNQAFAPWLKIFRSYGSLGDRPIKWEALMDADSAQSCNGSIPVIRALNDANFSTPNELILKLKDLNTKLWTDLTGRYRAAHRLNERLRGTHKMMLYSIDLEWAIVNGMDSKIIKHILDDILWLGARPIGTGPVDDARKMGSKVNFGKAQSDYTKAAYIRAEIAARIPFSAFSREVEYVIKRLLRHLYSRVAVRNIWNRAKITNPTLS